VAGCEGFTSFLLVAASALASIAFPPTHLETFEAIALVALGLYLIRFGRLAYRDPDVTIEVRQSFYWFLQPASVASRRFIRGLAIFGLFAGTAMITNVVFALLRYLPSRWLLLGSYAS
jgi:hypothetical protein